MKLPVAFDLDPIEEPVVASGRQPQGGLRGFGGGLFQKDAVAGTGTTHRSFHRLYPDAIGLSQVKYAREEDTALSNASRQLKQTLVAFAHA